MKIQRGRTGQIAAGCLAVMLWTISPVSAQDTVADADLQPLPEQVSAKFEQMFAAIEVQKEDIETLEARIGDDEDLIAKLLGTRRDRLWTSMFQNTVTLARDVAAQKAGGKDVSAYEDRLVVDIARWSLRSVAAATGPGRVPIAGLVTTGARHRRSKAL